MDLYSEFLVCQFNNGGDFRGSAFGKFIGPKRDSSANTCLSIKIAEKLGGAVDDLGVILKVFGASNKTGQMDKLFDAVKVSEFALKNRKDIESA